MNPQVSKRLISPCIVCEESEEVDSGMCEKCRQEALEWAKSEKKIQNNQRLASLSGLNPYQVSKHSQQGNPLADKKINPKANLVEMPLVADTYSQDSLKDKTIAKTPKQETRGLRDKAVDVGENPSPGIYAEVEKIIEELADLEHQQWSHLAKYLINLVEEDKSVYEKLEDWKELSHTDYKDLSKELKEKDRIWARKVLPIIQEALATCKDDFFKKVMKEIDEISDVNSENCKFIEIKKVKAYMKERLTRLKDENK